MKTTIRELSLKELSSVVGGTEHDGCFYEGDYTSHGGYDCQAGHLMRCYDGEWIDKGESDQCTAQD